MKRAARVPGAWLLCGLLAAAQAQPPVGDAAGFGWLQQLAGSCWLGTTADGLTTDTQCYELQYGKFLRGTIAMAAASPGTATSDLRGDSVWAWDEARKRIALISWTSNGTISTGDAWFEGDVVVFPVARRDGAPATVRTRWQRIDADSFHVTRQRHADNAWSDVLVVTYRRLR